MKVSAETKLYLCHMELVTRLSASIAIQNGSKVMLKILNGETQAKITIDPACLDMLSVV